MRSFSNTAVMEPSSSSSRRQPVRQTRTNPTRTATSAPQPRTSLGAAQNEIEESPPGFCPAITHFTDSITALPKEMVRHYTMLKEVDAKIYGPAEMLGQLVTRVLQAPVPPKTLPILQKPELSRTNTGGTDFATVSASDGTGPSQVQAPSLTSSLEDPNGPDVPRRRMFGNLRLVLGEMLSTLDEKNHVMLTAMDSLDKQLARCDSSYPYIANEVSEEARLGSKNHWAMRERTKMTTAAERTTRHLANTASIQEAEGPAARSEVRREAMAARKQRNQHVDSDFDERTVQSTAKKTGTAYKGRKAAEAFPLEGAGLGITNGAISKRRKVEKTVGGAPTQKAMSGVYGPNAGASRGNAGSPRETPMMDASKKRGRTAATANGTGRRRGNTNASAANSPAMASSPIAGTFGVKDVQRRSPAPSINPRAQPSRARQNSNLSTAQDGQLRRASSTSTRANGNGLHGSTADVHKVSGLTGRSVGEVKNSMKETAMNSKGERLFEDVGTTDGPADLRVGLVVGGRASDRSLKREEPEVENGRGRTDRPGSLSISTRGNGKNSKVSTPVSGTFAPEASRSSRATQPPSFKRSHKKGAGIAAQIAAQEAAKVVNRDEENSSMPEEDDEEDEEERRYCYCNGVSYGEMVGCDDDDCPREWFHLNCVGLTKAPSKNAKWYCDECKEKLKKSKLGNGGAR